jgi:hypothetical protein
MTSCPVNNPNFKKLQEAVGYVEARRDWEETKTIRPVYEVRKKLSKERLEQLEGIRKPVDDRFSLTMRESLTRFVEGLGVTVDMNADEMLDAVNLKTGSPTAAYDVLQKLLAMRSNISDKDFLMQNAEIIYRFLGRKSNLSNALFRNISKWSKYDEVYDKYYTNTVDIEDDYGMEYDIERESRFSPFAHKQAILAFLSEMLQDNFGKEIDVTKVRENRDIDQSYFKSFGLKPKFEENKLKRFYYALYNFIRKLVLKLMGKPVFEKYNEETLKELALDIVDDVYKQDYKKFLRNLVLKDGVLYKKNKETGLMLPMELKDYDQTLENDAYVREVIDWLLNAPFLGYKLSGSQTLRRYGSILREEAEDLHDIDGVITLDHFRKEQNALEARHWLKDRGIYLRDTQQPTKFRKEFETKFLNDMAWYKNVMNRFPTWKLQAAFIGKDHKLAESVTITGTIEHPTDTFVDPVDGVTKPKKIVLDFFLRTDEGNYPEIFDNYWKDWKQIFEAKLNMGRAKDMEDLVYFDPFIQDKYKFTNKGFRYFTFADQNKTGEIRSADPENNMASFYRDMSDINAKYSVLEDPIVFTEGENSKILGSAELRALVEKLEDSTGVNVQFVNQEEAARMLDDAGSSYNNEIAFYIGNQIYFTSDRLTKEMVLHEFSHPIIRAIKTGNRDLFESLYSKVIATEEGKELLEQVKRKYTQGTNKVFDENSDAFKEEVIVFALSRAANNKTSESSETNEFKNWVEFVLYQMKKFFRSLFKVIDPKRKISVENLDVNTSIDELARMLNEESFKLEKELLTEKEVVSFMRDFREEMLNDLANIEQDRLNKISRNFYDMIKRQSGFTNGPRFEEIRKIMSDKADRPDFIEIMGNLRPFQTVITKTFTNTDEEAEYMAAHAKALLNSLTTYKLSARRILEGFKEISKDPDDKAKLIKASYLNRITNDWKKFIDDIKMSLDDESEIGPGHPLISLLNEINDYINKTKKYSDSIYTEGVLDLLVTELTPMAANIDDYYKNTIEEYKKKNASQSIIDRYMREYEEVKLTPEKIKALLKGELGDAHALNSFLESYMYNQDPVITGFASHVKGEFIKMISRAQEKKQAYINQMQPLLEAGGYGTATKRLHMGKDMLFLDVVEKDDTGAVTTQLWKYINPYKDYEGDLKMLEKVVEKAKEEYSNSNTKEAEDAYTKAVNDLDKFYSRYMHSQFTEEYNKLEDMFLVDDIGAHAKRKRDIVLSRIQGLNANVLTPEEVLENIAQSKVHWREYKQLRSIYYSDGTFKPQDSMDYKIAVRLQEHFELSKKFFRYEDRPGAFQSAYLNFRQSLIDNKTKPGSDEFDYQMNKWLANNAVIKLNASYYNELSEIFAELASLSEDDPLQERITELFELRNGIMSTYRDQNGHPVGSVMPDELVKKIKEYEEEIEGIKEEMESDESRGAPGKLSKRQRQAYNNYQFVYDAYLKGEMEEPSEEATAYFETLEEMLKGSMTDEEFQAYNKRKKLFAKLFALQKRVPSQDFIDTVNNLITNTPEGLAVLRNNLAIGEFSESDIDLFYNKELLEALEEAVPEFKTWFDANHIVSAKGYKPIGAWTYTKPNDSKYYEKTVIVDDGGKEIVTLDYVPSVMYKKRVLNNEYVDDDGVIHKLKTERITMLDCIKNGIPIENATIDNKGRWLPRIDAEDKTYIQPKYFDMKANEPKKFAVLMGLLKNHLEFQVNSAYDHRLNLEYPRYEKSNYEVYTGRTLGDNIKQNPISVWARNIKAMFFKSADDLDRGLNPGEQDLVMKADMYDDAYAKIPMTGMYKLENDRISMDMMTSTLRYMQSIERVNTLLEMLPTARALQSIVQTPPKEKPQDQNLITKTSKFIKLAGSVLIPNTAKGQNIRKAAINAFIEREFEGKSQAGITANNTFINKSANQLMKLSSSMFFAFNIPSALKNTLGAKWQAVLRAAGGQDFNEFDYMRGSFWGAKVSGEIATNIYSFGGKSKDYQLVQLMDPSQGRFFKEIADGTNISRTYSKDVVDTTAFTHFRKFTELNDSLNVMGSMLKKTLIERTLDDGTTEKITYDEAWEVVDGKIKLKSGIDKEWDKDGRKFVSFVKKIHGINNQLNGYYAALEQSQAGRYLVYRSVMFMKGYFMGMFMHRFQHTLKNGMVVPRYDSNLETVQMGYYVRSLLATKNLFTHYKFNFRNFTGEETAAMRKTMVEVGLMAVTNYLIIGLLFGYDDDDEDRYEKLRDRSGSLPFLGIADDPDHPFKASGWFANHLLNLAIQVEGENDGWIPLPYLGLKDYLSMAKMESVAIGATVGYWVDFFEGVTDYMDYLISGDNSALYKRGVGPYNWQQQGGIKFFNTLGKMVSLSGSTVEPIQGIKGLESRERR